LQNSENYPGSNTYAAAISSNLIAFFLRIRRTQSWTL